MADRTAPLQTIYAKAVVHSCKSDQPFSRNVAGKQISIAASRGLPELVPFGSLRGGNPICSFRQFLRKTYRLAIIENVTDDRQTTDCTNGATDSTVGQKLRI